MDVSPEVGIVAVNGAVASSYPAYFSFLGGTSVRLEAQPKAGYRFDGWSGDLTGTENPATTVIDCNKEITANFIQLTYELAVEADGGGYTIPAAGSYTYPAGTDVNLQATADSGWQFEGWTGDVTNPELPATTVSMDSDKAIVAKFYRIIYALTIQADGNGATDPAAGVYEYAEGTIVDVTAIPDRGWRFESWSGELASPETATTAVIMNSNKTVVANFARAGLSLWAIVGIISGAMALGGGIWLAVKTRIS